MKESTPNKATSNQEGFFFLSEQDQHHLTESARNVINQLLADFPKELPDAVILPESSARPLMYLFQPIFHKVAAQRGVEVPKFYFLQREVGLDIVDLSRRKDVSGQVKDRAKEIYKAIKKENPRIIIIDDMASQRMTTIKDLREAFGAPLPAYVLLGREDPDSYRAENIKVGSKDPYTEKLAWGRGSYGFQYRRKRVKERINSTGVEKEEGATFPSVVTDEESRKAAQNLRSDMRNIGEKLAAEIT